LQLKEKLVFKLACEDRRRSDGLNLLVSFVTSIEIDFLLAKDFTMTMEIKDKQYRYLKLSNQGRI